MISDGSIPDVGVNSYNFFMEDIKLMKDNNIFHYRLSISWARIIPKGLKGSDLNQAGINHYRTLL
jgi:beta-glucosidase/6-phospho-beta-glucosidase/beta-galactosidase